MKKILVLFALTAIAMVSVNAQDNLKWGVMAGMNVSKYTFTGFDNRVGFHAGVKAELGLSQEASGAYMDFAALLVLKLMEDQLQPLNLIRIIWRYRCMLVINML